VTEQHVEQVTSFHRLIEFLDDIIEARFFMGQLLFHNALGRDAIVNFAHTIAFFSSFLGFFFSLDDERL
jgi:hypothetical protein